jgi:hypothetical protein
MNFILEMAAEARKDSQLLADMSGIYPGDPSGEITRDAIALEMVAQILEESASDIMAKATAQVEVATVTVS